MVSETHEPGGERATLGNPQTDMRQTTNGPIVLTPFVHDTAAPHVKAGQVDILGFSCRMPESSSPAQFWDNLAAGRDMVTEDSSRWPAGTGGIPRRFGKVPDLAAFDAAFFKVHGRLAQKLDPQIRKLLECTWEACMDAGIDVAKLRGGPVGVYVGCSGSDSGHANTWARDFAGYDGYETLGTNMSMLAARISWTWDFKGPCKSIDTACSSSLVALHDAVTDLEAGRCDYAVVGGSSAILLPQVTMGFHKLQMLSPDGACKAFDASANGYVRSDGMAVMVLARAGLPREAVSWTLRPPLATILASGTMHDGHTPEGIVYPNGAAQRDLAGQVCREAGIDARAIRYVEAHGTGTQAGDGHELAALDAAYGPRCAADPLLVGSVKSNMGHCEGASGLAGLAKVLLAFEHGYVPPNLHFTSPTPKSKALAEGRLKVVTEPESLSPGELVAVSSFGFGGTNAHMILRGPTAPPAPPTQATGRQAAAPREAVLPLASRTSEGLQRLAELLLRQPPEGMARLAPALARLASTALADAYTFRARGLLEGGSLRHAVARGRDVWFALSGNGSQWAGMAQDLLEASPTFASSVRRAAAAVAPLRIDLLATFLKPDGWANGLEAAVGLTAVQIGLCDMLAKEHSIVPAGFLGHSAGEIACAYLDGTFTLEQALLVAHARARAAAQCPAGVMASVGLSKAQALERLKAAGVRVSVVACDNSPLNVTLSGPAGELDPVIAAMDEEGIFVRKLHTNNVAFHCPLLDGCLDALKADLESIIPNPKQSTGRWLSTSQATSEPFMSDAAYQVNSFRNQVLFRTAAASIPDGAIVLEVGPHAVLRALLRQNKPELPYVASMRKGEPAAVTVRAAIQELWLAGAPLVWPAPNPGSSPEHLPREVREALVAWEYCDDFPLLTAHTVKGEAKDVSGGAYTKTFNLGGEHAYLADHKIDGQILIPATAMLVCAWEALAAQRGCAPSQLPVSFQRVTLHQAVPVQPKGNVTLSVALNATDGFQVLSSGSLIAEGVIKPSEAAPAADGAASEESCATHGATRDANLYISGGAFYADIARNRLEYGPAFRVLEEMNAAGDTGVLRWDGCFIRYLDGLLQMAAHKDLASTDRLLRIPVYIRALTLVQPGTQRAPGSLVPVEVSVARQYCASPLATVQGVHLACAPVRPAPYSIVRAAHEWVPYGERVTGDAHIPAYLAQVDSTARACLSAAAGHNGGLPPALQQVADALHGPANGGAAVAKLPEGEGERQPQEALCSVLSELFKDGAACKATLQDPRAALTNAQGYAAMRAKDAFLSGFSGGELATLLDIVGENCCSAGQFSACLVSPERDAHFADQVRKTMRRCSYVDIVRFMSAAAKQGKQAGGDDAAPQVWDINEEPPVDLRGSQSLVACSDIAPTCSEIAPALAHLAAALVEGGFLLLREFTGPHALLLHALADGAAPPRRTSDQRDFGPYLALASWRAALEAAGLRMVSVLRQPGDGQALMLYRKVPVMAGNPVFIPGPPETAQAMQDWLKEYLPLLAPDVEPQDAAKQAGRHAYLVGSCRTSAGLVGMMASLKWELGNGTLRCLYDVSCAGRGGGLSAEEMLAASGGLCMVQGLFKDGVMGSLRTRPLPDHQKTTAAMATPQAARLELGKFGQLSSLHWVSEPAAAAADGVLVNVTFASVNYKDIMLATGKLPREADINFGALGFEFSGRVEATGERVMGSGLRTFATKIHSAPERYWAVPSAWSLAEGATVPVAYSTAYYALVMRGQLEAGHRVLIHAGAGAVGMAAIRICLHRGCEVFTTCGSRAKREALLGMFPALAEDHIGSSRDTSFEGMVRTLTDGAGVDIVLNSLAGDKLQASVECLGQFGRLLEIGKYDMAARSSLPMHAMLKGVSYEGIVLDRLWNAPGMTKQVAELHRLVSEGIASGEVAPLPFTAFSGARVQDAFQHLLPGTHIGKAIVQLEACDARETAATNTWAPKGAAAAPPPAVTAGSMLGDVSVSTSLAARPGSVYILTGGLGGFGQALAMYLAQHGATRLVLTSRSGIRQGAQRRLLSQLEDMGVLVVISSLDVSVAQQARDLLKLAQRMGPLGGIFHLAMVLNDRLLPNMTGEAWEAVLKPKVRGAANLDKLTKGVPDLQFFVVFSSIITAIGNPGQTAYGYANSCMELLCQQRRADGLPAVSIQWPIIAHIGVAASKEGLFQGIATLMDKHAPLPVDDALRQLGPLLAAQGQHCVLQLFAHPNKGPEASKAAPGGKTLVQTVLDILGLSANAVGLHTSLAALGLDSMQVVNVRSAVQLALNVSYPLSEVPKLTLAKLGELDKQVRRDADSDIEAGAGSDKEKEGSAKDSGSGGATVSSPSGATEMATLAEQPVPEAPRAPHLTNGSVASEAPRALHLTNGSVPHHPDGLSSARSVEMRLEKAAAPKVENGALVKPRLQRSPSLMSRMASKWLCGGQSPQVLEDKDDYIPAKPAKEVAPLEDAPATHEALRPAVPSHPLPHMGACILATSVVCPEERMSADRLLQHVMARSQDALGRGGAAKMRFQLQGLLQYVKFKERPYAQANEWNDIEGMRDAVTAALEAAACQRSEIDLVIFTGCEKGMLEPAQAAMCAMAFGMPSANNFDIGEGCAAYIRAVEYATLMIGSGKAGRVLIVSAIAGVDTNDGAVFACLDDLKYKFAGLTVTVCATATILGSSTRAQDDMQLTVHRKADNNLAAVGVYTTHSWGPRFISIPEPGKDWQFGEYNTAKVMEKLVNRPGTAFGLSQFMFKEVGRMTKELIKERGQAELASWQLAITHSVALTPWEKIFRDAMPSFDCKNLQFNVFQHYGNCGENSLPVSIVQAVQQGRIKPGMRVGFVLPTAGVTAIIGGLNVAHVNPDGCFKRVLPARPGRARAVVEAVSLLPGKHQG